MVVDSHVHGRDFNERHKETVKHAQAVAEKAGVSGVFYMPNTNPALTTEDLTRDYIRLIDDSGVRNVFGGVYMGLTADAEQVKRAIQTHRELFPRVVGFKMYAGHSTNNLGVIREEDQRAVISTLSREGYTGVLFVHAEKEQHMDSKSFDYSSPITHAILARPPIAEVESIRDMLNFCWEAGFPGKLHIAHISTPEGVQLIESARERGQDVSCGVTPHHLIFDYKMMEGQDGLLYKMNPPLREPCAPQRMVKYLKDGAIDWVETDHAFHLLGEKLSEKCPSGVPALNAWPLFLRFLERNDFSQGLIERRTHDAIVDRFGIYIPRIKGASYDPDAYEVKVWKPLEKLVGIR